MKDKQTVKRLGREQRRRRVRRKISGTPDRPRLTVHRSLNHIYVQIIDDVNRRSLVTVSSLSPAILQKKGELKGKCAVAREVGLELAAQAKRAEIARVVFDRAGFLYHGRVKALAEGARQGGLEF